MRVTTTGLRLAGAGIAVALSLTIAGCAGGSGTLENVPTQSGATPEAGGGEVDCTAVGNVFAAFAMAAFSGMSTEATNGDVADAYADAVELFDAAQAPADAPKWDTLGDVIKLYASEWAALPADGPAIENIETVEATVDAFAESNDFDNDDYDDPDELVGATCAAELDLADG
jgi:hypothetical protein